MSILAGCTGAAVLPTNTGHVPDFADQGDDHSSPKAALLSLCGAGADDVFIVGADDGARPVALPYDGAVCGGPGVPAVAP